MKYKALIITVLCSFCMNTLLAQDNGQTNEEPVKNKVKTLWVVTLHNGKELKTSDLILGAGEISKLDLLSNNEIKKNYKDDNVNVVLTVVPKSDVRLLTLTEVLDKYQVAQQYRNYKVLFEGLELNDPKHLLASEFYLKRVTVDRNKGYVNLISESYKKNLKSRKKAKDEKEKEISEYRKRVLWPELCSFCKNHLTQDNGLTNKEPVKSTFKTLYIVTLDNGKELQTRDLMVRPADILKCNDVPNDEMKQNYKDDSVDVAYKMVLKSGVRLLSLAEVMDKYKVSPQYRYYKVLKEGILEADDPERLLINESALEKVTIHKNKGYLKIITKDHKEFRESWKKEKDEREERLKELQKTKNN